MSSLYTKPLFQSALMITNIPKIYNSVILYLIFATQWSSIGYALKSTFENLDHIVKNSFNIADL